MTFYSELAEVVVELLTEFGQTVILTRTTGGSVDPVTGGITSATSADKTTIGIVRPYNSSLIDGTIIKTRDKEVILIPTTAPLMTDKVNGMQIVNIDEINPAGVVLAYRVQVRA